MGGKAPQIHVIPFRIAGSLGNHHPKRILSAILHQILINGIGVHIRRLRKHCTDNAGRLCFLYAAYRSHDRHMQL